MAFFWPYGPSEEVVNTLLLEVAMHTVQRPRRYVSPVTLTAMRPVLRYSSTRDAFVLRMVGSHRGPVLRRERRIAQAELHGPERRDRVTASIT
jgi:hypothetical protein